MNARRWAAFTWIAISLWTLGTVAYALGHGNPLLNTNLAILAVICCLGHIIARLDEVEKR